MKTVLVVDDDPVFLSTVEQFLEASGYEVLQASDGELAIRVIEKERGRIDLAIVDLSLPKLNGYELIGALTRRPNSVKILATSGVFQHRQLEMATAVGAHAALRKPVSRRELPRTEWLNTIEQLIGAA
jgi:CheY-like chemotaxis protein